MKLIHYLSENKIPILIFLIIICQNPIWPILSFGIKLSFGLVLLLFIYKGKAISKYTSTTSFVVSSLLMFLAFIIVPLRVPGFMYSNIIYYLCFLLAFFLRDSDYRKALSYLSKYIAIIIIISLPAWLIHMFVTPLPVFGQIDFSYFKGSDYMMNNYLLFITNVNNIEESYRFYSMFDEPGVLGTLSAFVLFGNRYDFRKWYNIVILVGSLFTFSMAFFVVTAVGYMYIILRNGKVQYFFRMLILGVGIIFLLNTYSEGFQNSVTHRLNDYGVAGSLNRRTKDIAEKKFNDELWSYDFFLGLGKERMNQGLREGASWKLFVLERGFLALVVLVFCYFLFVKKRNLDFKFFFLLFFASFTQRPLAFYAWQILLFWCVIAQLTLTYKTNSDNTHPSIIRRLKYLINPPTWRNFLFLNN